MSKHGTKASRAKMRVKTTAQACQDNETEATPRAAKPKAAPKPWNAEIDGRPARARLDRPSRRHKADGGPLPNTAYRRRQNEISDQDRSDATIDRRAAVAHGLAALGNAISGDLPLAGGFGANSLYLQNRANNFDAQAQSRDAHAHAVEDLIDRSRGTDLRSRVFGAPSQVSTSDVADAGRRHGGKVSARRDRKA
ncbi:hypothetical protein [Hyphomicrobium sp. 2TAF46]|uniref:hypothetical protein n=1 Tax=Hyphomicrobium sp. 2TAF46 TaxID=3233019 RepID=UPI003F92D7F3